MLSATGADGQQGDLPAFQYPSCVCDKSQAAHQEQDRSVKHGQPGQVYTTTLTSGGHYGKEMGIYGKEMDIYGKEMDIYGREVDIYRKEMDI